MATQNKKADNNEGIPFYAPHANSRWVYRGIDYKRLAIRFIKGMLIFAAFMLVFYYGILDFAQTWALFVVIHACVLIYKKIKFKNAFDWGGWVTSAGVTFIILLAFTIVSDVAGGWVGWSLSILLACAFIIWSRWTQWNQLREWAETQLFGRPVMAFVREGKKPPRLKIKLWRT